MTAVPAEAPHPAPPSDGRPPARGGGFGRGTRILAVAGAVVAALAVLLALFDGNWLRGPIERYASSRTGREVRILGDIKVRLLTWTPRIDLGGLTIGNPEWGPRRNMVEVGAVTASIHLPSLLTGRVVLPLVSIRQPHLALLRDAGGRANWRFGGAAPARPLKLPPIQNFIIDRGRLSVVDAQRKLSFQGEVDARERRSDAYARGFRLTGQGALNAKPFRLEIVGGPLINVRADRPYPFDATVSAGATRVTAKGQVPQPFDLGVLRATVSVAGRDLNALYDLTGLALPNTPPYQVTGRLSRDGTLYRYEGLSGRVGRSDISGDASIDLASGRPFLKAKLKSRRLDFADLAGLFGAPGASQAAAPEQKVEVRALAAQGRLLPDATLQAERIRSMDAQVTYSADRVLAQSLPLRQVSLGVDLRNGVLKLDPVSLGFPTGRMTGTATIDARGEVPVSAVDFRLTDLRLEEFVAPVRGSRPLSGRLIGRARLKGAGNSVHRAAANAEGAVVAVIPRGQIRQAFAELMGVNVTKGLFMLLDKNQKPTDVRCALADFKVAGGTMTAQTIVFDTGVVLVNGVGSISLDDERLDLTFRGKPKKLRAVRLAAPITVGGRLREPKFGVDAQAALPQAGLGAILGAAVFPLAAILPFVSPGLEKDADCAALFAQARQSPAPVAAPRSAAAAGPR